MLSVRNLMLSLSSAGQRLLVLGLILAIPMMASAQRAISPQAGEYSLAGALPGDQIVPHLSINASGGFLVWEDNATDGDRAGISARRLANNLSGSLAPFRVNEHVAGDQKNPQAALLPDGGAVFVWQSSEKENDRIYARVLKANGTFAGSDITLANSTGRLFNPVAAALADGSVVVLWSDGGRDGNFQGLFAQRLSATGQKLGSDFHVNQFTPGNQRTPALAPLANGGFVVVWISELQRGALTVDAYARLFDAAGQPAGDEFRVGLADRLCANPAVSGSPDGGFTVVWAEYNGVASPDGWDILTRAFGADGAARRPPTRVNTFTARDQYSPRISTIGTDHLVVWISMGQDGSREGIYGQAINESGELAGEEFRVNTTTASQQLYPALSSDREGRFLVAWSGFTYGTSFDVFGQRYAAGHYLPKPAAPHVAALSQSRLSVTWPELAGYNAASYELIIDEAATAVAVSGNMYVLTRLSPASTHTFRLRYKLADGTASAPSDLARGTTWDEDVNSDQLPDDWQALYWGSQPSAWPRGDADSDHDGATNLQEFLAGTDPQDPASALRLEIVPTSQGHRLSWATQPGLLYQVQFSTDLNAWSDLGSPRFAASLADSMAIDGAHGLACYRVIRLR